VSVNRYRDHVVVIPEDDANRQLVNGFLLHQSLKHGSIDVRSPAGGWEKVLDADFRRLMSPDLRHLILLVDFDGKFERRREYLEKRFPSREDPEFEVRERVYLIGCLNEPEVLRRSCGMTFEQIGIALAGSCVNQEDGLWGHDELAHNKSELERLMRNVRPILFG